MSSWLSWLWGSAEAQTTPSITPADLDNARAAHMLVGHGLSRLVDCDILTARRATLTHVEPPEEKLHILEFKPAVLAPTTNLALIRRSWLGITVDVLGDAIRKLRRTETTIHDNFVPRSAVLQELMAKHPRIAPTAES